MTAHSMRMAVQKITYNSAILKNLQEPVFNTVALLERKKNRRELVSFR